MKKFLFFLLIVPLGLYAQQPVQVTNPYQYNKYVKVLDSLISKNISLPVQTTFPTPTRSGQIVNKQDTLCFWTGTAWVRLSRNTWPVDSANYASKYYVRKAIHDSLVNYNIGSSLNSGFLRFDADSSSSWPYPNKASAKNGGFYYVNDEGTISLNYDSLFVVNTVGDIAIEGNSVNSHGIVGTSNSNTGIHGTSVTGSGGGFTSNYGTGLYAQTTLGSTNALFGADGDSTTFPRIGGMKVYNDGILVFRINSNGTFENLFYDEGEFPYFKTTTNGQLIVADSGSNNLVISPSESVITGSQNIMLGAVVGGTLSGEKNTIVGTESSPYLTSGSRNIIIGSDASNFTTQSNRLILNSIIRGNILGDTTKSIIYGVQSTDVNKQKLYFNAAKSYFQGDIYKINSSGDVIDTVSWDGGGTSGALMPVDTTNGKLQTQKMSRDNYHPKGGLNTLNISALAASASQFNLPSSTLAEDDEDDAVIFNTAKDNFIFEKPIYTNTNTVADSLHPTIGRVRKMITANNIDTTLYITLENYGAVGNGIANDSAAFSRAILWADYSGKIIVPLKGKTYYIPHNMRFGLNNGITIHAQKGATFKGRDAVEYSGSYNDLYLYSNEGPDSTIYNDLKPGDSLIYTNLTVTEGETLELYSSDPWSSQLNKGEIVIVHKTRSPGIINVFPAIKMYYNSATTIIRKRNAIKIDIQNVTFDNFGLELWRVDNINIQNNTWKNTNYNPLMLTRCFGGQVVGNIANRRIKYVDVNAQYGFSFFDCSELTVKQNTVNGYQQTILAGHISFGIPSYGLKFNYNYNSSNETTSALMDYHPGVVNSEMIGNTIYAPAWGAYIKGVNNKFNNNYVYLTTSDGVGVVFDPELTYNFGGYTNKCKISEAKGNHIFNMNADLTGTVGIMYTPTTPNDTANIDFSDNFIDVSYRGIVYSESSRTRTLVQTCKFDNNTITVKYGSAHIYMVTNNDSIGDLYITRNNFLGGGISQLDINHLHVYNLHIKGNNFNSNTYNPYIEGMASYTHCYFTDNVFTKLGNAGVEFYSMKRLYIANNVYSGINNAYVKGYVIASTVDSSTVENNRWEDATPNYTVVAGSTIVNDVFRAADYEFTDGNPTASQINTATGRTAANVGIGCKYKIKDISTGLIYTFESNGSGWQPTIPTLAP